MTDSNNTMPERHELGDTNSSLQDSETPTSKTAKEDASAQIPLGRKLIWAGALLVALYFIGQGVIGVITGKDKNESEEPLPAVTVTEPAPTPSGMPIEKSEKTAFTAALPDYVLQFTLTSFEGFPEWKIQDSLEQYQAIYSGTSGSQQSSIEVLAAQFPDEKKAAEAYSSRLVTGARTIQTGEVTVDSHVAGLFDIATDTTGGTFPPAHDATPSAAGTTRAIWTNGSALFEAYGPEAEMLNFYKAYAL